MASNLMTEGLGNSNCGGDGHGGCGSDVLALEAERTKRLVAMGQMAASLAHEIRNPLGSIKLFCGVLKNDLTGQEQHVELIEEIEKGIFALEQIVTNSLQFARDLRPKRNVIRSARGFIDQCLSSVLRQAVVDSCVVDGGTVDGIDVQVICEFDEPVVADEHLLRQALVNLLQNSLQALDEKRTRLENVACGTEERTLRRQTLELSEEENLRLEVRSELARGLWNIAIRDTGIGICQQDIERIFEPFYTTKRQGVGLGMSVVHSLVRAQGGAIRVESERGVYTVVTISLPQQYGAEQS